LRVVAIMIGTTPEQINYVESSVCFSETFIKQLNVLIIPADICHSISIQQALIYFLIKA